MTKIKLSPEQEAFAREIGATHYEEPPENLKGVSIYWKNEGGCIMWHTISGSSGWIDSHYGRIPEDVMQIDFTATQEPDWKAVAQDLLAALSQAEADLIEHWLSDEGEWGTGSTDYESAILSGGADKIKRVREAIKRAKEAGL